MDFKEWQSARWINECNVKDVMDVKLCENHDRILRNVIDLLRKGNCTWKKVLLEKMRKRKTERERERRGKK